MASPKASPPLMTRGSLRPQDKSFLEPTDPDMSDLDRQFRTRMNSKTHIPGLDALFREQKRLANKLTYDELRALKEFVKNRVFQDTADLYYKLQSLQSDYDVALRNSSETIANLRKELEQKQKILDQYKSSDDNILKIQKQREERWEKKQKQLEADIEKYKDMSLKLQAKMRDLEKALQEKEVLLDDAERKVAELEKKAAVVDEAKEVLIERDKFQDEILRLKLEMDKRDKYLKTAEKELLNAREEREQIIKERRLGDVKVTAMKNELEKQVAEVAEKCKQLTESEYALQDEKRQVAELQRELKDIKAELLKPQPPRTPPGEALVRKELEVYETKIVLLELKSKADKDERIRLENEVEIVQEMFSIALDLKEKLFVHGETNVEKVIIKMCEKLEAKDKQCEMNLREFRERDESYIRKEAVTVRAELLAIRKQTELIKMPDLVKKATKLLNRLEACIDVRFMGTRATKSGFKTSWEKNSSRSSSPSSVSNKKGLTSLPPVRLHKNPPTEARSLIEDNPRKTPEGQRSPPHLDFTMSPQDAPLMSAVQVKIIRKFPPSPKTVKTPRSKGTIYSSMDSISESHYER
ncbi:hypothetical protein CHS0354_014946 [Potamilus streckersoni]|uniref:Uncharacterized protein n=1 Tax=Potamilus streckersoni TaxID=2493646 RepID=A0AAE0S8I9_9BIVA|nr:hypothetical protein CHS0354_014946 [Potamilus streckersoni]